MTDFQEAIDRTIGGLEKKSKVISPKEKKIVAWHEAGHAVVAWFLEHASPLVKVSIIPRGPAALGYAQYLPKEQAIYQEDQLKDKLCTLLGGRAAEELIFGKISTGAGDDLERSTALAYDMVKRYGMNKEIGHLSFRDHQEYYLQNPYSNALGEKIDKVVQKMINTQYERAKKKLRDNDEAFQAVAQALLKKEVLFTRNIEKLAGKRPFPPEEEEKEGTKKKTK